MPTLLQINTSLGRGSTGKIANQIGALASEAGWRCFVAHGSRFVGESAMTGLQVSGRAAEWGHYLKSHLLDEHGLGSAAATMRLLEDLDAIKPDVVHLHNIHGYYVNYPLLLGYLAHKGIPTVVTMHDFWLMTGHCAYIHPSCGKWQTGCGSCPRLREYPASLTDASHRNWTRKKACFKAFEKDKLCIVPVSHWLEGFVKQSLLQDCRIQVLQNGVDTARFKPYEGKPSALYESIDWSKHTILTVADRWTSSNGYGDILNLNAMLPADMQIVMVGLSEQQFKQLPEGIIGVAHTENVEQLIELYTSADVLFNASQEVTFGLVTAEAMACGTPAIVFEHTAGEEIIDGGTGYAVQTIERIPALVYDCRRRREEFRTACRERIVQNFDASRQYAKYIDLYNSMLG